MLVREAAPVEFEAPVIAARSRGEDPEVIAELERARILALRVRAILDQRRRREAELSALYETANDLAALREVDAVLQATSTGRGCSCTATSPTSHSTTTPWMTPTCGSLTASPHRCSAVCACRWVQAWAAWSPRRQLPTPAPVTSRTNGSTTRARSTTPSPKRD